ncbi:CAP domain-containing protein [Streptomyces sp. BA2]|uniref:CAP domain-containing protein n=1 Tax=Streptomyces sp. BA2 TaxID=436595 RepID=UPI001F429839|nr:CAP domain-containing protein [Streptomyces sp. BA2]
MYVLALLLLCAPSARAEPRDPGPPPYPVAAGDPQDDMADEINQRRTEAGCPRIRLRHSLNRAAQGHSADMARHERLTHRGHDGSRPADRMRAAGYRPASSGEVLVVGPTTAGAAVERWMDSPPHRAIILACRYTHAGVGVAAGDNGPWWAVDLAAPQ